MTLAVRTATFVAGDGNIIQTTGKALKCATYTATLVTTNDWCVFGDFTTVTQVYAEVVATGVHNPVLITASNKGTFQSATVGAHRMVVWGY